MSTETERKLETLLVQSQGTKETLASVTEPNGTYRNVPEEISDEKTETLDSSAETDVLKKKLSIELGQMQNAKKASPSARSMQAFREKLPAFKLREEFIKAVAANQGPPIVIKLQRLLLRTRIVLRKLMAQA